MIHRSYRVSIRMKKIVFTDKWACKPDKDDVLEWLISRVQDRAYENHFTVTVEEPGRKVPKRAGET